jgi:hypothetical protein
MSVLVLRKKLGDWSTVHFSIEGSIVRFDTRQSSFFLVWQTEEKSQRVQGGGEDERELPLGSFSFQCTVSIRSLPLDDIFGPERRSNSRQLSETDGCMNLCMNE